MSTINKIVTVQNIKIANHLPLVLIAGPCQMESREHAIETAAEIKTISARVGMHFIYKTSFDKANRTSINGKRGIGMEQSLPIFAAIKQAVNCPICTDIHNEQQCAIVSQVVDILQIPAFLCRQTDILLAAGKTGCVINIKKGPFLAPLDISYAAEKVLSTGNEQILLTERGVSFGYNTLVNDMRALTIMAKTGYPVIFDATHSVQQPSGQYSQSGGQREFIRPLARAATAIGIAAVYIETHQDPDNAPSDGPCMVQLNQLEGLLNELIALDKLSKRLYSVA